MQRGSLKAEINYREYLEKVHEREKNNDITLYNHIKRVFDILFSLICLPLVILLIAIFSILIKLESRGNIFYIQERVGLNGKRFNLIKLRSMRQDAEKNGPVWAFKKDSRVTRTGKLMRVTRIDELPQFFNVLKGDMSIIGPRPERHVFITEFEMKYPGFSKRLLVKPGLTGWAQVNGGYEVTPKDKLVLDMYYIKNQSIKLDFKILLKTIRVVLTGEGAR